MDKSKGRRGASGRRREPGEILFLFLSFLCFFSDLRKSDRRFSSGLKTKLIYATELLVDTKILEFRQTLRGRVFILLVLFSI